MMEVFAVSDVHGHYSEMMAALREAGFDPHNEEHFFLSCGDLFDRGFENYEVYKFVSDLPRRILLKGNHEDILSAALERTWLTDTDIDNGTAVTVRQLLGDDSVDVDGRIDSVAYADKITELRGFTASMLDYYEIGDHIFTHGWLPVVFSGRYPSVDPNWRNASSEEWVEARLLEWQQFYAVGAVLDGKVIVCGHRPSRMGNMFDPTREPDDSTPFYGKGMIVIDAGTVRSGRVNVLRLKLRGDKNETFC